MRRGLPWLAAAFALGVVLVGGSVIRSDVGDGVLSASAVTLTTVERGTFVRAAQAFGILESVQATPVTVPVEAPGVQRIAWVIADGTFVREGDVVVRFDPTDMERDLADGLDARTRADLEIRRTTTDNDTKRATLLLDAEQAESEYEVAESFASRDATIFSRHEIIDSEIDRELAARTAETAREREALAGAQGRTAVELLEIERGKADLKVRTARQGLGALTVAAPHDGLLVLERDWRGEALRAGDQVWPGRKVAEIPDPGRMQARLYVLEADAGGLEPGLDVTLRVEAHPDRTFAARVSRVDALAKPRDPGVPVNYFEAVVVPERTDSAIMKPGQRVEAEILLEEIPDALTVPRQAVFDRDGTTVAYRERGGRLEPVEVSVGANSLSHVIVRSGLEEGDRVALRDPSGAAPPSRGAEGGDASGAGP